MRSKIKLIKTSGHFVLDPLLHSLLPKKKKSKKKAWAKYFEAIPERHDTGIFRTDEDYSHFYQCYGKTWRKK